MTSSTPRFAPGQAAAVTQAGRMLAAYGAIEPEVAAAFDLNERTWALLVDVASVREASAGPPAFVAWSEYPAALRDLAVVIDEGVAQAEVLETIQRAGRPLLASVRMFDEYRGEQIASGKRSLAYALSFAAPGSDAHGQRSGQGAQPRGARPAAPAGGGVAKLSDPDSEYWHWLARHGDARTYIYGIEDRAIQLRNERCRR